MTRIIIFFIFMTSSVVLGQQHADFVFQNVNIISMQDNSVLKKQNIAVLNGKIIEITSNKINGNTIIDLKGKYIMPSLADAHVHFPEKEIDLEQFLNLNLINGVTKLRSMRGDWKHLEWKKKFNSKNTIYPTFYLAAPPISRNLDFTVTELDNFVKKSKENDFKLIKILSIKSQELFKQLDSLCKKYNMPLGGHFPRLSSGNSLNETVFFNSNYQSIEHLGGLVGEPNLFESRVKAIKEKNIFICPTLLWYSIGSGQYSYDQLQKLNGMEFIPKKTMQDWMSKTKEYRDKIGEKAYKEEVAKELNDLQEKYQVIARLQKEGIKMLLSPDASSKYMITGFNMLDEMELLKNANLTNFEILQMATVNFALLHDENFGIIGVNRPADFIVLDKNPLEDLKTLKNIKGLFFNNIYLDSNSLQEMKKKLLEIALK
jgi:hypothetical protein